MPRQEMLTLLRQCLSEFDYIVFAVLFGSRATGFETEESDVDIAIFPSRELDFDDMVELICRIAKCLRMPEDKIDIVILSHSTPLELRYKIFRDGIPIIVRDEEAYKRYRDLSISMYLDFKIALEKVRYGEKYIRKAREILERARGG